MKIYILFFLIFSSFDLFSSSPVTKKQLDAYNVPIAKLESSVKAIMPKVEDFFSKVHQQAETVEKKSVATTPNSTENKESTADTYTNSNGKNNVKHLGNVTETGHEGSQKKAETGGKSRDAYEDAVLKMKSSMYNYFSMIRDVFKNLEGKGNKKSGFTSTSNENKEHIADAHVSSNVKNDSKHLNNTIDVRNEDDLRKVVTKGSSFDAYNVAIQEIESFMNVISPKIEIFFSNMHTIFKSQPEERKGKSRATSKLIKQEEHKGEVYTNPNVLNEKKSLDNASDNEDKIGLSYVKANESLFDASNNAIMKRQASIKVRMPHIDDYFLKRNHILKRHVGKREDKSMAASMSTENKQHILVKEHTSSNVKNDENNLGKAVKGRRENEISSAKINEKSLENQHNRDLEHHPQVTFSNSIAIGNGKVLMNSTGKNSNTTTATNNTTNELSSLRKPSKVNFNEKEILNSDNKDAILKSKQPHESSNEVDYQIIQANRSVLVNLSTGSNSQNKSSSVSDDPENELQKHEELKTRKSDTDTKNLKNMNGINDNNVTTASTNSKAELTDTKESSRLIQEISSSSEEISKNYQKTNPITPTDRLVNEDQINVIRSEKSPSGSQMIKQENSDGKTLSFISTIGHAKQYKEGSTKKTGETSQEIEIHRNDKQVAKNKIMTHSTSTSKLDDSDTKSRKLIETQLK